MHLSHDFVLSFCFCLLSQEEQNRVPSGLPSDVINQPIRSNVKEDEKIYDGQSDETPDVPLVYIDEVLAQAAPSVRSQAGIKTQQPIFKNGLSRLTTEKLENYFLLLVALDENLKENSRLREKLASILTKVKTLNESTAADTRSALFLIEQKSMASII